MRDWGYPCPDGVRRVTMAQMGSYTDLLRAALAPTWAWRVPCARPVIYFSPIILSLNPHNTTTLAHNATGTRGDRRPHAPVTPTRAGEHRLGRLLDRKLTRNTEPTRTKIEEH